MSLQNLNLATHSQPILPSASFRALRGRTITLVQHERQVPWMFYSVSLPSGYKSNKINWLLKSPKSFSEFDV